MRDIVVITIAVISIDIGFLSVSSIIEGENPHFLGTKPLQLVVGRSHSSQSQNGLLSA